MRNFFQNASDYEAQLDKLLSDHFHVLPNVREALFQTNHDMPDDWYVDPIPFGEAEVISTFLLAKEFEAHKIYPAIWYERFLGKIPDRWSYWRNLYVDMKNPESGTSVLQTIHVDAVISHPLFPVARNLALARPLQFRHLAWLFARPLTSEYAGQWEDIVQAQTYFGTTNETLAIALSISQRVKTHIKKCYEQGKFDRSPNLSFPG